MQETLTFAAQLFLYSAAVGTGAGTAGFVSFGMWFILADVIDKRLGR